MKNGVETYKKKRMAASLPYICAETFSDTVIAVVIPVLNEYPGILGTLKSLALSFSAAKNTLPPCLTVLVVNNRVSHDENVKQNNRLLMQKLNESGTFCNDLPIKVIDCVSNGRELPETDGVGLARKIGMDYALCCGARLLACLDADTLVETDYFSALAAYLAQKDFNKNNSIRAAVTGFSHQKATNSALQKAIEQYELYLKTHCNLLVSCGFPYFPVALGPTIVCTAVSYAAAGGMCRKKAGEDFYFLQALIKVCPDFCIDLIPTEVHPAARFSDRVPFGTGIALEELLAGKSFGFPQTCYDTLKRWIDCVRTNCTLACKSADDRGRLIMAEAREISTDLADFCQREKFAAVWTKLFQHSRKNPKHLETAFFCWFDALKGIRLFHYLQEHSGD